MNEKKIIDIKENDLLKLDKELLELLLKDRTTGKNIIWATDNYSKHGSQYDFKKPLLVELITSTNGSIIKPRTQKSKTEQQQRVRQKAEVFTPAWVCNVQNNLIDNAWFGRENVFNTEKEKGWTTNYEKIDFPEKDGRRWKDYVNATRLEITCGEAPYITSRYDAVTGDFIEVCERVGFLDRKLRIAGENTQTKEEWLEWAFNAVKSTYGFEWQGDSLLIARENVLFDVIEHFEHKFHSHIEKEYLLEFAKIISWNLWQMDGLKFVVPESCKTEKKEADTGFLFEEMFTEGETCECEGCKKGDSTKHNGIYCKIMDWKENKKVRFVDIF